MPPSLPQVVFIANRGEIANRIRRTTDALGIRAVVPQTEGPGALDLLDIEAVVAAAGASGADAVHPGFGFLAESAPFAEAVIAAGLLWVGPPPAAIRRMGDKAAARRLAVELGVPVVAGYDDTAQDDETLMEAARAIGVPLLVKPAAGGGGKGMHVVRDLDRLPALLETARREARTAFGDDRLILERLLEGPRHVEVQVLFDAHGSGVHLGERDCSVQRRHQKVLEETPSPAVGPALRARLGDAALRLGAAVGYEGAGTCEFLVDDDGEPVFLEMNTRLQVEHPVTELVTGRDLVADQLRIAAGEPLGFDQRDVRHSGHAVEVRLYAEDADAGFLPATGRIAALRWPSGPGVRVDAGVELGSEVTNRFDPMLAKVIAHGATRTQALERLTAALDDTVVLGVTTNLRFLRWLVRQPVVLDGEVRIDTLDRIWPAKDAAPPVPPDEAWARAAHGLAASTDDLADAWRGGWRLNAPGTIRLETEGIQRTVTIRPAPPATGLSAVADGDVVHVDVAGRSVTFGVAAPPDVDRAARAATRHAGGPLELVAPMPGSVVGVHASAGTRVSAGDPVVTLEAMKMEHVVRAPFDGLVTELPVARGDQVVRGQPLAVVEP